MCPRTSPTSRCSCLTTRRSTSSDRRQAREAIIDRARRYLGVAIFCEVSATLALRAADQELWWYGVVVVGYVASFVVFAGALRCGMTMGVAYAIWSAFGVMLTAIFSAVLFSERLTWLMLVGFVSLVAGVVLIESGADEGQPVGEHVP
jgi:small multidrug resistance pump